MRPAEVSASIRGAVEFEFSRSGGPGGQNVNKVNTKVQAWVSVAAIEGLGEAERLQLLDRLAGRIDAQGRLSVQASEERSQAANRERATERLIALVLAAARRDPPRIPTKPGRAARERRLASKRSQGIKKSWRRKETPD